MDGDEAFPVTILFLSKKNLEGYNGKKKGNILYKTIKTDDFLS